MLFPLLGTGQSLRMRRGVLERIKTHLVLGIFFDPVAQATDWVPGAWVNR